MRTLLPVTLSFLFALCQCPLLLAQDQQPSSDADKEVTKVIEDFWTALGEFNAEGVKQTFDWPVSIVESSATETTNPRVLNTPKDLDNEFTRHRPASGRSEFHGTKLSDFKVQLQSPTLALVTYRATLPKRTTDQQQSVFNAIAVVRKTPYGNAWKIIFMSVPK